MKGCWIFLSLNLGELCRRLRGPLKITYSRRSRYWQRTDNILSQIGDRIPHHVSHENPVFRMWSEVRSNQIKPPGLTGGKAFQEPEVRKGFCLESHSLVVT